MRTPGIVLYLAFTLGSAIAAQPTNDNADYDHTAGHIVKVTVSGAVRRPGVYSIPADHVVWGAITLAGGYGPAADRQRIRLRRQRNGKDTYIAFNGSPRAVMNAVVLARDGDHINVPNLPPALIPGATARITILPEIANYMADFTHGADTITFSGKLMIHSLHVGDLFLPVDIDQRIAPEYFRLDVRDTDGVPCVIKFHGLPPQVLKGLTIKPDHEKLLGLPAHRVAVPKPGKYRIIASVAFRPSSGSGQIEFVDSEPIEVDVLEKIPASP